MFEHEFKNDISNMSLEQFSLVNQRLKIFFVENDVEGSLPGYSTYMRYKR